MNISSGIKAFDVTFQGYEKNDLTVFAQRPGSGSIVLMINSAIEHAKLGSSVLFASVEMTENELFKRALGGLTDTPIIKIFNTDNLKGGAYQEFRERAEASSELLQNNLRHVTITNINEIVERLAMSKVNYQTDIVYIDYGAKSVTKKQIYSIRKTAKENQITVILFLCNAGLFKQGKTHLPNEEGVLKFQAEGVKVYGAYRDVFYNINTREPDTLRIFQLNEQNAKSVRLEIDIAKQVVR